MSSRLVSISRSSSSSFRLNRTSTAVATAAAYTTRHCVAQAALLSTTTTANYFNLQSQHQIIINTNTASSASQRSSSSSSNSKSLLQQRLFSSNNSKVESIRVPDLGEDIKDATFIKWLKHDGDNIDEDEVIGTIETDKVACDVRAPSAGVIHEILVQEGDKVKVGQSIATIKVNEHNAANKKDEEVTMVVSDSQPNGKGKDNVSGGRVAVGPNAAQHGGKGRKYHTSSRTYMVAKQDGENQKGAVEGDPRGGKGEDKDEKEDFYGSPKDKEAHGSKKSTGKKAGKGPGPGKKASDSAPPKPSKRGYATLIRRTASVAAASGLINSSQNNAAVALNQLSAKRNIAAAFHCNSIAKQYAIIEHEYRLPQGTAQYFVC